MFSSKPDRLRSLPLTYGGEIRRTILIRKGERGRFEKHLDQLGTLNIKSLVDDSSLSTNLLIGKHRPKIFANVIKSDTPQGIIFDAKHKHLGSLVVSHNNQLIQMLGGKRFDYLLTEGVLNQDFAKVKGGRDEFEEITYEITSIDSMDDPSLTFLSVVCSDSPASIEALPIINEAIIKTRGSRYDTRVAAYRDMLAGTNLQRPYHQNLSWRLGSQGFSKGDKWYSEQQKYWSKLIKTPLKSKTAPFIPIQMKKKDVKWMMIRPKGDSLTIINEADYLGHVNIIGAETFTFPPKISQVKRKENFFDFKNYDFTSIKDIENLEVFAAGLTLAEVKKLLPLFKMRTLRKLAFLEGGIDTAEFVVANLSADLISLNLESTNLRFDSKNSQLSDIISAMNGLEYLNLRNTMILKDEFSKIVNNLPQSIRELYLSGLNSWTIDTAKEFSKKTLQNLKTLDLRNSSLDERYTKHIFRAIPSHIEELYLNGMVYVIDDSFKSLLIQKRSELTALSLGGFHLNIHYSDISLPKLTSLHIGKGPFNNKALRQIKFGKNTLRSVKIVGVKDVLIQHLVPFFDSKMELLELEESPISATSIASITKNISSIETLRLNRSDLALPEITALTSSGIKIKNLDLSNNRISNSAVKLIAESFGAELKSLNLSDNPISEGATQYLTKIPYLEKLYLNNVFSIDIESLIKFIHPNLKALSLAQNQISDQDMILLAPSLPPNLGLLNLNDSRLSNVGLHALAKHMPQLSELAIDSIGEKEFLEYLPTSLSSLQISLCGNDQGKDPISTALPPYLKQFEIRGCKDKLNLEWSQQTFPRSLQDVHLYSIGLNISNKEHFAANWPGNLRFLEIANVNIQKNNRSTLFKRSSSSVDDLWDYDHSLTVEDQLRYIRGHHPGAKLRYRQMHGGFGPEHIEELKKFDITMFFIPSLKVKAADFHLFSTHDLRFVRYFDNSGSTMNGKELASVFRKFPPYMIAINIPSSQMQPEEVDEVIASLPPYLGRINISGSKIGEKGISKFRAYAEKVLKEKGFVINIVE